MALASLVALLHDDIMNDDVAARAEPVRPTQKPIRLIDEKGVPVEGAERAGFVLPEPEMLLDLYRGMVLARRFDVQVTALTRQGRLATYPSAFGQEACEIGAVRSLGEQDWLFPTYRDSIALLTRGVPPEQILSSFRGDWHMGFDPYEHRISPQATPLATQALHAVGLATAAKLKGDDVVALTLLGDGATSEGDAHEAFNFASVWQAPVVFVVQNNGYAISVPFAKQSHARTLADRAIGYGMPGYFVDGNDVAAMHAVTSAAVQNARSGGGPTLIEGLTYRIESHTNSDDPTRYRSKDEVAHWKTLDPVARLETYLRASGALGDELRQEIADAAEELAGATRDAMNTNPVLDPLELFDHVYAAERPALREQRAFLERELAATVSTASVSSGSVSTASVSAEPGSTS
ncbi:pyruvate dehydrogenase (acetyl-transferring) E1 component subunit alpha [Herbiconiux sp. CPCC 205763]|uniref:Pyruvate dehydrogenase (Acetyl-transferring) E1 component subunit alpha n=1 Tax=Herbiconiux aconitum TaxID=2970913 RepID=A0ABT2GLJ7_9MICO|nr:pyruvate dehydrogenase (acetyl-transferring) E1 component subunit alpha [Herbiconiux aconitum]MCS5717097.1 pyruvate dehydrogenase (acetyl-transferring) E1 component subunit alpha [Herbiconiux aconitum]